MEDAEVKNYSRYLHLSKDASLKLNAGAALGLSFLMLGIYGMYGYSFWVGSLFIEKGFYNRIYGRPYSAGDVIAIFFAIITGLFAIGGIGSNAQSVNGG